MPYMYIPFTSSFDKMAESVAVESTVNRIPLASLS